MRLRDNAPTIGHAPVSVSTPDRPRPSPRGIAVPMQQQLEQQFNTRIVTYEDGETIRPGGMCGCCGSGPNANPDWRADPWYVYRAGICDVDGVYHSMLCEGCLEDIRFENDRRPQTERDETARQITDLMGDDLDGAQAFMEDLQ